MMSSERRRALLSDDSERFPAEPTTYSTLLASITSSGNWAAPEDGWFEVRLHGKSGAGSEGSASGGGRWVSASGGSGGGGSGSAVSRIKMIKGDRITFSISTTCYATIQSSLVSYAQLSVTSATNATSSSSPGTGGVANGGNYVNANGQSGKTGTSDSMRLPPMAAEDGSDYDAYGWGGSGGAPGYSGGRYGGSGGDGHGYVHYYDGAGQSTTSPGSGKPGCAQIYRGDTN